MDLGESEASMSSEAFVLFNGTHKGNIVTIQIKIDNKANQHRSKDQITEAEFTW